MNQTDVEELARKLIELEGRIENIARGNLAGVELQVAGLNLADSSGAKRIALGISSDDEPSIALLDSKNRVVLSLSVVNDVARVLLHDSAGNVRVSLGVDDEEGPVFYIADEDGTPARGITLTSLLNMQ